MTECSAQTLADNQIARLQRRIVELEAKVADYKRALKSAYRCVAVVQDAVQEAEANIFNWQEELRDEP